MESLGWIFVFGGGGVFCIQEMVACECNKIPFPGVFKENVFRVLV